MSQRYSRRTFFKRSAVGAAVTAMASTSPTPFVLAGQSPRDKLRVAVIGAAGMGGYSVDCALNEQLVALVDVDEKNIAQVMRNSVKNRAKPKVFYDYRKMLDDCRRELDVVLIATPDHHHAPAAIRAIHDGKHVFCQKPLAHNIAECYALAKAAREKKVLTQMGNQGYCSEVIRRVAEHIAAGAIGTVTETHTILDRNFGGTGGRPPAKPVPAGLHWDEWIGPAAYREYHDGLHPFSWRDWKAFGTGTIGDMACHRLAYPFMALRLWEVKKFTVECINTKGGSDEKYPQDNVVCYHIPARDKFPACKCYVYDHQNLRPEVMKELERKHSVKWSEATLFVGSKGYLDNHAHVYPEAESRKLSAPPKTLVRPKADGPIEDLCACIRTGGTPVSNFSDAGGPLTAMALTGHLAQYAGIGGKIEWDVEKMECTNKPEFNRFVRREYRAGWQV
jgi:predicted dehydrogenase